MVEALNQLMSLLQSLFQSQLLQATSVPFVFYARRPQEPKLNQARETNLSRSLISFPGGPFILGTIGLISGAATGMFGIGGGLAMVPLLSIAGGSHQLAIGTSLCAMLVPTLASVYAHSKIGNVNKSIALPLTCGAAIGAFFGSRGTMKMSEYQQICVFSVLMAVLITRNLQIVYRLSKAV